MDNKIQVAFAAINQRLVEKIPENKVITANTNSYAYWGDNNRYPNFLYSCYKDCPTLQSIINGYVDYVIGNGISSTILPKPNSGQDWDEFITNVASDYLLFGITYIQVIRDKVGRIIELHWLDSRFCRTDVDNELIYYNEDYAKNYVRTTKQLIYPKFMKDTAFPASVIIIKTPFSRDTYGTPIWQSALKDVMVEIGITDFHLSVLDNNFCPSGIINFNNGVPTQEQQDEVEKLVTKKFTGTANAGRFMLAFNNGKDNAVTVEKFNDDNFDKKYDLLAKKTKDNIYAALRANPQLFGNTLNTGFADQDFDKSFRIFNRTVIFPIQKRIVDGIDKIFGVKGSLSIEPFGIDFTEEETVDNTESVE
ncbi:MAG: phage portal protein [Clostridia bacterium]|nr:phage portal protein [Clostridia bacterium]